MRVLIVKTSSMGDVIHTLPALVDAKAALPGIVFDWVVEPAFAQIVASHDDVDNTLLFPFRQWRKNPLRAWKEGHVRQFLEKLRAVHYDYIIDAQGLLKSAVVTRLARGTRCGFNRVSAREGLAACFYTKTYPVLKKQHAVQRTRQLFAQALNYAVPHTAPEYGLTSKIGPMRDKAQPYLIFLHGTTWQTKHWPLVYWEELVKLATQKYPVYLPWGNDAEKQRASQLARISDGKATVLPALSLMELLGLIQNAKGVVGLDTGLVHMAAAVGVPTVSLYGPTDPVLSGALGNHQTHLKADFPCAPCFSRRCHHAKSPAAVMPPCFATLMPLQVWEMCEKAFGGTQQYAAGCAQGMD